MDDIIKDFLIESKENLDRLDQELVQLESDPTSRELLDSIFRTIHTIKGSCGFLGFSRLEKVAHAGENLLSKLREGQLTLNSEITSGLLAMVDAVRRMLGEIQATERDGDNDYPDLLAQLKALQENNPPAESLGDNAQQGTSEAQAGIRIVEAEEGPPVQVQPDESAPSPEAAVQPQAPNPAPRNTCVHFLRRLAEFLLTAAVLSLLIWPLPYKNRSVATGAASVRSSLLWDSAAWKTSMQHNRFWNRVSSTRAWKPYELELTSSTCS